jgi:hypothetical protein
MIRLISWLMSAENAKVSASAAMVAWTSQGGCERGRRGEGEDRGSRVLRGQGSKVEGKGRKRRRVPPTHAPGHTHPRSDAPDQPAPHLPRSYTLLPTRGCGVRWVVWGMEKRANA